MHKKRLVISSIFVLLIIAGIGIIFFSKTYGQSNTVVRVQTVNINSKAKKIANYDVLANGKNVSLIVRVILVRQKESRLVQIFLTRILRKIKLI